MANDALTLKGIAIVTGGSGGIGAAICRTLATAGYDIVVFDIMPPPTLLCNSIENARQRILYLHVDVSQEEQVSAGCDYVIKTWGDPVILINNAAIYPRALVTELDFVLWQRVLDVNLGGTFLCSRSVAPAMIRNGGGVIVNIASGRALQGARKGAHYAASKAGVLSLTKSLALEWSPTIRVNAVIPGVTDTAQPRKGGASDAELYARGDRIPLKRIGQPQDTAWAVEYLVSDRAAYITGQSLCVNGGSIMQ
ncbi:MAG: hypothetical protein B7Z75_06640 [Acidocella sp. 20-57-95]|nr:MAG: hypothetical protein B7Z75_06640 [Acidocella sp. 20-57-95]HQT64821.1 SDR family NAD(P)-dependent oxidoreductase [Acidocella sp.]